MASIIPINLHLSAKTRMASIVLRALIPAVWIGLVTASISMLFVRLSARLEGWGGD